MSKDKNFKKYIEKNISLNTNNNINIYKRDILFYIRNFNQYHIITKNNILYSKGLNNSGQLAINNDDIFLEFYNQNDFFNKNIIFISNGIRHSVFMTNDTINNIYTCGLLGTNFKYCSYIPKQIKINKKIIKIACGIEHTLLLTDEDENNLYGLGIDFNTHFFKPINLNTNKKILNIDCSQHTSIYLDTNNNIYIFGNYKKTNYKYPTLLVINKKILNCVINFSDIFFITSENNNNLYIWNKTIIYSDIIFDKLIIGILKQNETIICIDYQKEKYYYGKEPLFINNTCNIVFNKPIIKISNTNNLNLKLNLNSRFIKYKNSNNMFNNTLSIDFTDTKTDKTFSNIISKNSYSKIINLKPSGTKFCDYIDLMLSPSIPSNNYKLYFFSSNDTEPHKLANIDNGYGSYYTLYSDNTYKIFTKHFSKICLTLEPDIHIKNFFTQYKYTNINNDFNIKINSNYVEEYFISDVQIININNNQLININYKIKNLTLILNSPYEFFGLVKLKIHSLYNPNIYNINFQIKFINNIQIKKIHKITLNDIYKINIYSCMFDLKYNKKKIKVKYKNNFLFINPLVKTSTYIYLICELFKYKLKIIIE